MSVASKKHSKKVLFISHGLELRVFVTRFLLVAQEKVYRPLGKYEGLIANETTSLLMKEAWKEFHAKLIPNTERAPILIIVSTDGYSVESIPTKVLSSDPNDFKSGDLSDKTIARGGTEDHGSIFSQESIERVDYADPSSMPIEGYEDDSGHTS